MKIKIFYSFALFLLLFLIFLIGEVATRLFFKGIVEYPQNGQVIDPYKKNPYLIKSKQFIHSHYPNIEYTQARADFSVSYKTNSYGFRDNDFTFKPTKKRMLVVGDSLVEGHGVEYKETFTYFLKKEFETQNLEVLNMGIQGTSFKIHAVNLERFFKLKPDAILFCLNENDWIDDRVHEMQYRQLPILENPSLFDKSYSSFLFNFKFVQFTYFQYYKFFHSKSKIEKVILSNLKKIPSLVKDQSELDLFSENRSLPKDKYAVNFDLSREYFNFILEECQKRNIKVFFTNVSYLAFSPNFEGAIDRDLTQFSNQKMEEYLKEKKIPYLDLKDVVDKYYKENPKGTFFIVGDGHPTKEAQRLFAEKIFPWLEKLVF
ncbi:MAG: SGNH/GDSL hydrolase family protein [Leptospiraceae bacterium]|nr:SGNH/GDSL hydrolase family protein [Leptospiraceae bacterium]